MRVLKYAAYVLGGIVLLLVIAASAALTIVDGAFVKSRLQSYMAERHRTLSVDGDPRIRIFPVAGISFGRVTLTEPGRQAVSLSFDSAEIAIRTAPLLAGAVVVELLSAKGLRVNVQVRKDGRANFEDLEPPSPAPPSGQERPEHREPPKLVIRQVDIEDARLSYVSDITGQQLDLGELNLSLGPLADSAPSPLKLSARISGHDPDIGISAQASGLVMLDLARRSVAFRKIDARVNGNAADLKGLDLRLSGGVAVDARKGQVDLEGLQLTAGAALDRDALSARLSAPRISVTRKGAGGSAVTGAFRLVGPERKIDARLNIAAAEGTYSSLSLPAVELVLEAAQDGGTMKAELKTPVHANLDSGLLELPKLSADLYVAHPRLPHKSFRLPVEASLKLDRGRQTLSARAAANAEDFDFKLQFDAKRLAPLEASFDFSSDRLNLDRYPLAAAGGGKGKEDRLDLSSLVGPALQGRIRIGALQAAGARLTDVAAEVRLAQGVLEATPHSARLYGGALTGSLSVNARGNRIAVKEDLQGIQINPLLRDLVQKDVLEGRGDIRIDISGSGPTASAFKRSLAGSARLQLKNGAYKGINLAQVFRRAQAALGGRGAAADSSQKTDFTELGASFVIKDGVAHNDDLVLKSPFLRAGGSGDVDLAAATLDYTLRPTLVAEAAGQEGRERPAGVTVPVRLHGPLDAIGYEIDTRGLVSGELRRRLGEKLNEGLGGTAGRPASPGDLREPLRDQVRDRLRGLLNR